MRHSIVLIAAFILMGCDGRIDPPAASPAKPLPDPIEAAIAALKDRYRPEHAALRDSIRLYRNDQARSLDSIIVGEKSIGVEHRHIDSDPGTVLVTGLLDVQGEKRPFLVYLAPSPGSQSYRVLDVDIHGP